MAGGFTETVFLLVTSIALSSIVVVNAFYQKEQFYSSVVYITKSNASMGVIYVQALVCVYIFGNIMKKIFFGTLRPAEFEHVVERSWYALTETCLAFTVFRDDLSPKFVALFTCLFSLKLFHWLAEDRVDYMERSPNISLLFHIRVNSLLLLLGLVDLYSVYSAYNNIVENGISVQLVFGFEYAILFAVVLNIAMKYVLHFVDLYNENPWEDKAIYLLYTEMIMSILKIILYTTFIVIMARFHTFPLFAIRPMYLAIKSFRSSYNDIVMSRRAIANMNTLYPNATEEDIANSDNVCIICRDIMHGNGTCKKLPCNHILHISCLRSWFQRQQTCPTCRMDVLSNLRTQRNQTPNERDNNNNAGNVNANQPNANNNNNNNNHVNNNNNNRPMNAQPANPNDPAAVAAAVFAHLQGPNPVLRLRVGNFFQFNNRNNIPNGVNPQPTPAANPMSGDPGQSSSNAAQPDGAEGASQAIPSNIYPHLAPPPFPMPDLTNSSFFNRYTDEQLRQMAESVSSRESIEMRLKMLMDTQLLIDSAVFSLQQYNGVLAQMSKRQSESIGTQTDSVDHQSVDTKNTSSSAAGTENASASTSQ